MSSQFEDRNFINPKAKYFLLAYFTLTLIGAMSMLVLLWPNQDNTSRLNLTQETAFLISIAAAGFIGSTIHVITSFTTFIGGKRFQSSWTSWYISKGYIGAAFAVLMYLSIRGFIVSSDIPLRYINTYGILAISFVTGLFSDLVLNKLRAAVDALLGNEQKIESRLKQIDNTLGTATLDNYRGIVYTKIARIEKPMHETNSISGFEYDLTVWFEPASYNESQTESKTIMSHQIEITDGNDTEFVDFKITPKSDTIKFMPAFVSSRVTVGKKSSKQTFKFTLSNQDAESDNWLEISQKNRLITAFSISPFNNYN